MFNGLDATNSLRTRMLEESHTDHADGTDEEPNTALLLGGLKNTNRANDTNMPIRLMVFKTTNTTETTDTTVGVNFGLSEH